jgi:hypothetical protein
MAFPKQKDIEIPLLKILIAAGGPMSSNGTEINAMQFCPVSEPLMIL